MPLTIGITGAEGLLGYHLHALLHAHGNIGIRLANRHTFTNPEELDRFVLGLDGLAHFAGMNRGDEAEVEAVNVWLAETLVASLKRTGAKPAVVYANSTHIERDTGYGRGKRQAAAYLSHWAQDCGAAYCDLILPNVFGEFGRPFYNSVVATFCHQLAVGEKPTIHADGLVELIHTQTVARQVLETLKTDRQAGSRQVQMNGIPIHVRVLLDKLQYLHHQYLSQIIPRFADPLDLPLFNTLRSYLFPQHYPVIPDLHSDARGHLFEAVKSYGEGQTFLSSTHPGVTRGNHYHLHKVERFLVIAGDAEIRLRRLFRDEITTFRISGDMPCYIDMPTFHTHAITNTGERDVITLFWSNEIFDPNHPDTFAEAVLPRTP